MTSTQITTLLFTDVVGSTGFFAESDDVRRAHFQLLRDATTAAGGTEVKNLGDGVMCTFPSASAAVDAAVAMQQAVERSNRRSPAPVGLRVGVHVGEVTVEAGDCFGTAVVVAERLCKAAEGGQIVVSDLVRTLARARSAFGELGRLELKGVEDPVDALEVVWEPDMSPAGGIPMPVTLTLFDRTFFVARESEREQLRRAFKRVVAGGRSVAFLSGEPGAGKTRLAAELAYEVADAGGVVLYGKCDPELGVPYEPFVDALRHYVTWCPVDVLAAHVTAHRGELTRIVPEIRERVADVPPPIEDDPAESDVARHRLLESSADLVVRAARTGPLLLVLDDLHWAARPTLLMLRNLLARTESEALMILGIYRDTDLARTHPLADALADLRRRPETERLALHGFDEDAVVSFVEAAAGERLDERGMALARAIHRETEGNPFFVGQVLRHLVESGRVVRRGDAWTYDGDVAQLGIPEGVREVVGRRMSRLSEEANRVLQLAAVAGLEFEVAVLEHALDGEDVLDAVDEAAAARIVQELPVRPASYRFTHAVVRETLYGELSSVRRAALHTRIGQAIEACHSGTLQSHYAKLARHFGEGPRAEDAAKAAEYAVAAGRQALNRVAYEEALEYAERGLEVLALGRPHHELAARLHLLVMDARLGLGEGAAAMEAGNRALGAARASGSRVTFARVVSSVGSFSPADWLRAESDAEEALTGLGDDLPELRASLLTQLAVWRREQARRADVDAMTREAVEITSRPGLGASLVYALSARCAVLYDDLPVGDLRALAERCVDVARATGNLIQQYRGLWTRSVIMLTAGDRRAFQSHGHELSAIGRRTGGTFPQHIELLGRVGEATWDGRFDEAEWLLEEARQRFGGVALFAFRHAAQLALLRIERGQLDEALSMAEAGAAITPRLAGWRAALAALRAATGDIVAAERVLDETIADDYELLRFGDYRLFACSFLAEACAATGRADVAAFISDSVTPQAGRIAMVASGMLCGGSTDRTLGICCAVLGRHDEARAHFDAALDIEGRVQSPVLQTRTRYWQGWALIQAGDREAAKPVLERARADAERIGMLAVASAAAALQ